MRTAGTSLRTPGVFLVLALAVAIVCASGCGEEKPDPAEAASQAGAASPDVEPASAPPEPVPSAPAAPLEGAEEGEPRKGPNAYEGLDLGFPGCAEGECARDPDSTYVPTPDDIVEKMLELAEVGQDDLVYDLGSGDGRSVIAASRIYGVRSVGVELNERLARSSRERVEALGLSDLVEIRIGDMFEVDLSKVDVLVLYQPPKLLERMKPQLAKLRPGSRIVSHFFLIPGIEPDETRTLESDFTDFTHKIYLWKAPLPLSE